MNKIRKNPFSQLYWSQNENYRTIQIIHFDFLNKNHSTKFSERWRFRRNKLLVGLYILIPTLILNTIKNLI